MGASDVGKAGQDICTDKRPFLFAVSGYKNTGKTTLIERLIPILTARGYKVAVIKHDGHDFECDVPGTDSWRHRAAGAFGTAVYSAGRIFLTREYEGADERLLCSAFPDADIILLEGLKDSDHPKYVCGFPDKMPTDPGELADMIEKAMAFKKETVQ